jgi:hypothetical protein
MRLGEGGLKNKYEKKRVCFLKKNIKKHLFWPTPAPTFSRAVPRAGFVVGCLAVPTGGCGGGSGALCALGLGLGAPAVGLDAPVRL